MTIYRTAQKESFMAEVSDFILANFTIDLNNIKIILPNGYLCNYLQKELINKTGTAILPNIIPINDISSSMEETFKIPSDQIGKVTSLEEKMIMTKIIFSYDNLHYSTAQTINLSSSLIKLFFEFEANDIDFTILKNIPTLNQAEHWHFIYDFLEFAYQNWQEQVSLIKKSTAAQYQKLIFTTELTSLQNSPAYTIIAGVIGNNKITKDFIVGVSKLQNSHIILPPFSSSNFQSTNLPTPEEPLYNIYKLLNQLNVTPSNLAYLNKTSKPSILDNLLTKSSSHELTNNIEYIEFNNIILEAEYVASTCSELLAKKSDATIAILITNDKIKDYFTAELDKYGLNFSDLIGENILNLHTTSYILEVAKNIFKEFSLKNFTSLILHPLIICDETRKLKQLITKHNRFAQNIDSITEIINNNFSEHAQVEKLNNICKALSKKITTSDFSLMLATTIEVSKTISPNLWEGFYNNKIAITIMELINSNWVLTLDDLGNFPEILQELLSGGRIYKQTTNSNITICSANEITLMNYDLVIYTNFIQNSYPLPKINSPWLNNQMIKEIGLDSWDARFGNSMYDFYLNLHNQKLLITRSIKTDSSSNSMPSPFLLNLKHILGTRFTQTSVNFPENTATQQYVEYASADFFPKQLSATDIETLIRAPYNFYVKKILNLKAERELEETPSLSEFGNFFHKIAELYTKNYEQNSLISHDKFNNYAKELLNNSIFPKQTQNLWQLKIEAIAQEFISFDNERRKNVTQVFSELRGELALDIHGTKIKIVAIADRIELNKEKKAIILDYKTGYIPTKKDVLSGLSPQLIIESIILLEGGFAKLGNIETESLIYIKVASKEPYISTTEVSITKNDILTHKQGLINLLHHYINTGKYPIEPNLMNYDDYWHLARRN
ncbi:MAG: PD-(D/E)XK nuclease family protein [Rickettsiaceae bacterium]